MDILLKLSLYGIAALALLVVNLWFLRIVIDSFSARELPNTIAPIRVIGAADQDGHIGQVLAGMLLARLSKLQQEMSASAAQLRAPVGPISQVQSQAVMDTPALVLPERLFEPIQLDMKIAGVELGGVVSWMQRSLSQDDVLQLAVENGKGHAVVSGTWNGGRQTVWVELTGPDVELLSNERIVSAMAYALAQKQFANRIPEVGALEVLEFQLLLGTLSRAATLQHQVKLGRIAEADFAELFGRIDQLIAKTPRWSELLQLGAVLADNAGKPEKAIDLYSKALALSEHHKDLHAELSARITHLTSRVVATKAATTVAAAGPVPAQSWPLSAIGVKSLDMTGTPRVAVLGGLPAEGTLGAAEFELAGKRSGPGDQMMGEYLQTVVNTVRLVAPKARFVFAPSQAQSGQMSESDLLSEISALAKAKPDVLLITMGPLKDPIYKQLFASWAADTLIVNAAGNQGSVPIEFEGEPVSRQIATVASIGVDGGPSAFTQRGKDVLWAPGEKIPVKASDERVQLRDGTTYSAALTAGVAARILAENPHLKPAQVLTTLRETAQPTAAGKPAVINLAEALKKLHG